MGKNYYTDCLTKHGTTPQGVGWQNAASQKVRFQQFNHLLTTPSILDYGCGTGDYYTHLKAHGYKGTYHGYDTSPEMIAAARKQHPNTNFDNNPHNIQNAATVIASGLLNHKDNTPNIIWQKHVDNTLNTLWRYTNHKLAFNALSTFSDPAGRGDNLYYTDPADILKYCLHALSPHVTLNHDYGQYDFTITVRR